MDVFDDFMDYNVGMYMPSTGEHSLDRMVRHARRAGAGDELTSARLS